MAAILKRNGHRLEPWRGMCLFQKSGHWRVIVPNFMLLTEVNDSFTDLLHYPAKL